MISVSVSIDVPTLEEGLRFYGEAFGFVRAGELYPGVLALRAGSAELLLLAKTPGSSPSPHTSETRHYGRHWTPVHLDFHVDDFHATLTKVLAAGARQERLFESPGRPAVAFCSDPFGHGFCLIERRQQG
jgi:catechol 2,3-dioxygenase-like lactoylglutathione lyase family enzyme